MRTLLHKGATLVAAGLVARLCLVALAANAAMLSDLDITTAIETHFLLDRTVNANRLDVTVTDGIVELRGHTDNLLAKERATRIAERVRGVRAVSNRIEVVPAAGLTDESIRSAVQTALVEDPATEAYEVQVGVQGGVVTLEGRVDSLARKDLAGKVAKGVRGVVGMSNRLRVELAAARPDEEIREEIRERLRWDVLVDDALIEVEVSGGRVELRGTVGSLAEKRQAERDSWVHGVRAVDADGLEIDPQRARRELRGTKYAARTHEAIVAAIRDALSLDPRVSSFTIEPQVYAGGWVTLRGDADNLRAKQVAERIARHTVGVINVTNLIKVRPESRPTDPEIEQRVQQRLARNPLTSDRTIEVDVSGGEVVLGGTVGSFVERIEAEREASTVSGVTDVINGLRVTGSGAPPRAYYSYPDAAAIDLPANPPGTDRQIEAAIRNELRWSPFVDAANIEVTVVDGVAQLEGNVNSWREYHAAEDNAREGGAKAVRNRLQVE